MRLLVALVAALLVLPVAAASADTLVTLKDGELGIVNEDVSVKNNLTVDYQRHNNADTVHLFDETDANGMSTYPTECSPGKTNAGFKPVEIFCPRNLVKAVNIDSGPNEDIINYKADQTPTSITGNVGSDQIHGGPEEDQVSGDQGSDTIDTAGGNDDIAGDDGNDTITAGDGNDKINGGTGADTIDAGPGDDNINTADGVADKVTCGDGNDTVTADTVDELAPGCENIARQFVDPPADQPAADDHTPPKVQAGALTTQKVSLKRRTLRVAASSSESGLIGVTGYLVAAGVNDRLTPASAKVTVAGAGVEIKIKLAKRQAKMALRDLKHHKHPRVRLTVAATDAAGNTSSVRRFWVYLAR